MEGITSDVLPDLDWGKRSIIWLDYDYELRSDVLSDLEFLAQHASSGSIVIVTNNAEAVKFGKEEKERLEKLRGLAGSLFPSPVPANAMATEGFPSFLADILFNHLEWAAMHGGKAISFYPLFNYYYSDSSRMVTVGGMLTDETDKRRLNNKLKNAKLDLKAGRNQTRINVPPLTAKE